MSLTSFEPPYKPPIASDASRTLYDGSNGTIMARRQTKHPELQGHLHQFTYPPVQTPKIEGIKENDA